MDITTGHTDKMFNWHITLLPQWISENILVDVLVPRKSTTVWGHSLSRIRTQKRRFFRPYLPHCTEKYLEKISKSMERKSDDSRLQTFFAINMTKIIPQCELRNSTIVDRLKHYHWNVRLTGIIKHEKI